MTREWRPAEGLSLSSSRFLKLSLSCKNMNSSYNWKVSSKASCNYMRVHPNLTIHVPTQAAVFTWARWNSQSPTEPLGGWEQTFFSDPRRVHRWPHYLQVLKPMRAFSPPSKPVIHHSFMGPRFLPLTPPKRKKRRKSFLKGNGIHNSDLYQKPSRARGTKVPTWGDISYQPSQAVIIRAIRILAHSCSQQEVSSPNSEAIVLNIILQASYLFLKYLSQI